MLVLKTRDFQLVAHQLIYVIVGLSNIYILKPDNWKYNEYHASCPIVAGKPGRILNSLRNSSVLLIPVVFMDPTSFFSSLDR